MGGNRVKNDFYGKGIALPIKLYKRGKMKKVISFFILFFLLLGCANTRTLRNEINRLKIKNRELERRITALEQNLKKQHIEKRQEEIDLRTLVKRTSDLNNRYVELYEAINEVREKLGLKPLTIPPRSK